jgi:hypothetical protein
VKDYATLSRVWVGDWPAKVFRHKSGEMKEVQIDDFPAARKSYLLPPPKTRPRYGDVVQEKNKGLGKKKPWVRGLYEGIIAVDLISKQRLEQRNRIALIVLDSTLEIAFKEYLVNESGKGYSDSKLFEIFKNRYTVQDEVKKYVRIAASTWSKVQHYYLLRNKLVHERVTVGVSDEQVSDYRELVESVLQRLFKVAL